MEQKTLLRNILVVLVAVGVVYISFNGVVRMRIDQDKAVFYVKESRWLISALQEDRLFSGTRIVKRDISSIIRENWTDYDNNDLRVEYRSTTYENGEMITHTWKFNPYSENIEDFPYVEKICVLNAKGKYYRYSLKKLSEPGPKRKLIDTFASFGRNMKVSFQPGYSWAWIGWPYGSNSFAVQYKIQSNNECFDIRLFDPPLIEKKDKKVKYEFNKKTIDLGNNKYNMIIGGQLYADENGTKIEEAPSLKSCQYCSNINLIIDSDKTHLVNVLDYNFTSIILNVSYNESFLGEYEYELEDNKMKTKLKVLTQLDNGSYNTSEIEIEIEEGQKIKYTLPFGFDRIIKFGSNSTTIQLQNNETDILADVVSYDTGPSSSKVVNQIMVNISSIPASVNIDDVSLCFYAYSETGTFNTQMYVLRVLNYTWTESISLAGFNSQSTDNNLTEDFDKSSAPNWICINSTTQLKADYDSSNNFSTIRVMPTNGVYTSDAISDIGFQRIGVQNGNNYMSIYHREYTTDISLREYFNITYTEADSTPPTVTLGGPANASTNTSLTINFTFTPVTNDDIKNCTVWTNETSWSAKETNTSTMTNNTLYGISETFSSDGNFIWNVECYDTIGNGNFSANNYTITISSSNPCDCPSINTNFTVPTSCNLVTPCNIGTGSLNHSGSGSSICNTTITYSNRIQPPNGYIWRIAENCYMNTTG
jgi:hypothetical protein